VCDCVIQLKKRMSRKSSCTRSGKNASSSFTWERSSSPSPCRCPTMKPHHQAEQAMALETVSAGKKQTDVQIRDIDKVIEMKNRIERYLKPCKSYKTYIAGGLNRRGISISPFSRPCPPSSGRAVRLPGGLQHSMASTVRFPRDCRSALRRA